MDLDRERLARQIGEHQQGGFSQGEIVDIMINLGEDSPSGDSFSRCFSDIATAGSQPDIEGEVIKPGAARPGHAGGEDDFVFWVYQSLSVS